VHVPAIEIFHGDHDRTVVEDALEARLAFAQGALSLRERVVGPRQAQRAMDHARIELRVERPEVSAERPLIPAGLRFTEGTPTDEGSRDNRCFRT